MVHDIDINFFRLPAQSREWWGGIISNKRMKRSDREAGSEMMSTMIYSTGGIRIRWTCTADYWRLSPLIWPADHCSWWSEIIQIVLLNIEISIILLQIILIKILVKWFNSIKWSNNTATDSDQNIYFEWSRYYSYI